MSRLIIGLILLMAQLASAESTITVDVHLKGTPLCSTTDPADLAAFYSSCFFSMPSKLELEKSKSYCNCVAQIMTVDSTCEDQAQFASDPKYLGRYSRQAAASCRAHLRTKK